MLLLICGTLFVYFSFWFSFFSFAVCTTFFINDQFKAAGSITRDVWSPGDHVPRSSAHSIRSAHATRRMDGFAEFAIYFADYFRNFLAFS